MLRKVLRSKTAGEAARVRLRKLLPSGLLESMSNEEDMNAIDGVFLCEDASESVSMIWRANMRERLMKTLNQKTTTIRQRLKEFKNNILDKKFSFKLLEDSTKELLPVATAIDFAQIDLKFDAELEHELFVDGKYLRVWLLEAKSKGKAKGKINEKKSRTQAARSAEESREFT